MLEPFIITRVASWGPDHRKWLFLSGVPDLWDRNKILRGGDLSHLHVPDCIWIFFYFVWFVFIYHNFQFYFELCTYCNILDIHLLWNLNYVNYLQVYMRLLNFLFCNMLGSVLECYECNDGGWSKRFGLCPFLLRTSIVVLADHCCDIMSEGHK